MKKKSNPGKLPPDPSNGSPLAYTTAQLSAALGGISARSIKRLEERKFLQPLRILRCKLYPVEQVRNLLKEENL